MMMGRPVLRFSLTIPVLSRFSTCGPFPYWESTLDSSTWAGMTGHPPSPSLIEPAQRFL